MRERQEFSRKTRAAAFERAGGCCEKCTARLYAAKYVYDHIIPDWLGGEPTLTNCQVICMACDGVKTPADQRTISKVKRIRDRHIGAKPKGRYRWPKRPFASQWRNA